MNLFENLQLMKESDISCTKVTNVKNKLKLESTNNLWNKFVNIYDGFVPINDLSHYFSLDKFGEFVQWCRKEADLDYDYGKRYDDWDEVFKDLDEATGVAESISLENIFKFFTIDDLTGFWDWVVKEYDIDDGLEESKHLKEYKSNINNKIELWHEMFRYTDEPFVLFKDLFNCYSIDDLQDLYDYLSSEYEDEEFAPYKGKLNSIDELWDEMNKLVPNEKVAFNDVFNCYSLDKLKDLYDYLSSEYSDIDDYDENLKRESKNVKTKTYNSKCNFKNSARKDEYIVESIMDFDDWLYEYFDELVKEYADKYGMSEQEVSEDEDFEEYVNDEYAKYYKNTNRYLDEDFEILDTEQEFTSAETSINGNQLPAIVKMINLKPDTLNIDYGGGKYDNVTEYYKEQGVTSLVYDPYNRDSKHNSEVLNAIRKNGGADSVICSNVLNVIKEENARNTVIKNIYNILKTGSPAYFTVYESDGKGIEGPTSKGYQLRRKTALYVKEIEQVFSNVKRKGKLIIAIK